MNRYRHGGPLLRSDEQDNAPIRVQNNPRMDGDGRPQNQAVADVSGKASSGNRNWRIENLSKGLFVGKMDENSWEEVYEEELRVMNSGKVGAPFRTPDSVIRNAMMKFVTDGKGYRDTAAKISLELNKKGFSGISYSQLKKRSDKLNVHILHNEALCFRLIAYGSGGVKPDPDTPLTVAIDSTGMSPDPASGWMAYHWDKKQVRGWYKLHVAVDTYTNRILAYAVTTEYFGDNKAFDMLMDIVFSDGHTVEAVYADAAYDAKTNWNRMRELGIRFIANIRGCLDKSKRSAGSGKAKGSMERAKNVLIILKDGRKVWMESVGYGRRWKAESTFSDMKRMFGDTIRARGPGAVADVLYWIIRAFNLYKECRIEIGRMN